MQPSIKKSLNQALSNLRAERATLDQSIAALETLFTGSKPARAGGRPARSTRATAGARQRRKPKWSAASRKAAAARMRAYWAARRKTE